MRLPRSPLRPCGITTGIAQDIAPFCCSVIKSYDFTLNRAIGAGENNASGTNTLRKAPRPRFRSSFRSKVINGLRDVSEKLLICPRPMCCVQIITVETDPRRNICVQGGY